MPEKGNFPENVKFVSVLEESSEGVIVRPECLPFKDESFDQVIFCGAWESVLDPCGALMEAERVSKSEVQILYRTGHPKEWQTFQMDKEEDWKCINKSSWDCEISSGEVVDFLKQTVSFGAVNYKNHSNDKEVVNESIA